MPYKDPEKQRAYQLAWMLKQREQWIKANGPCTDCGTWEWLEVDHSVASTKVTHRVWSWSQERRKAELAKCTVRCHPCHRTKTVLAGEAAHAKLHATQIREIRKLRSAGITYQAIATQFNVAHSTIIKICKGTAWKHIE